MTLQELKSMVANINAANIRVGGFCEDYGKLHDELQLHVDKQHRAIQIVNTEFWVFDFLEDVPTRFSKAKGTKGQTLVQIRPRKDSPESEARKFFTGSQDILYILQKIREMKAFHRRVTLRSEGNRYYFE